MLQWAQGPRFYSPGDESAFFAWLESIAGVTRVEGSGSTLRIHFRSKRLSKTALRELAAIYKRYGAKAKSRSRKTAS